MNEEASSSPAPSRKLPELTEQRSEEPRPAVDAVRVLWPAAAAAAAAAAAPEPAAAAAAAAASGSPPTLKPPSPQDGPAPSPR